MKIFDTYFWHELFDFLGPMLAIFTAVLALFCLVFTGAYFVAVKGCESVQEVTGKPTRTDFMNCYIQHQGEWMLYSTYEAVLVARDGLTRGEP